MSKLHYPHEATVLIKVDKLFDRDDGERKTKGGIIIASDNESANREELSNCRGTIVAMGEVAFSQLGKDKPKVGDKVMFNSHAGATVKVDDTDFRYIPDNGFIGMHEINNNKVKKWIKGDI